MKKILAIISICSGIYSLQAQSLGDVDLSRFVYGDNNTKTSYFDDPNSAYPSGFYNQHTGTNMPYETWWHMIINRHMNTTSNYQFQIAADFWGENTYFRKLANEIPTPWRRIMNDGQDVYAASLNQHLRTTDNVTFASATINGTQSIMTSSLGDLYGTDQAFIGSNLVLKGVESSRTVGRGSSLTFAFPANTDGSNIWEQARILASPDNTFNGNAQGRLYLQVRDAYNPPGVGGSWNWRTGLMISANGNVGIGSQNPDQKLTVKGKIHAEEVIIDLAVPADYVFKPNYKLMPLHQVEQFVKTNSHLPEIPSAKEITKNGLSVGEMQNMLLQKVEELTLYAIQQDKSKIELERKYNVLLEKVEMLTKQLEKK